MANQVGQMIRPYDGAVARAVCVSTNKRSLIKISRNPAPATTPTLRAERSWSNMCHDDEPHMPSRFNYQRLRPADRRVD